MAAKFGRAKNKRTTLQPPNKLVMAIEKGEEKVMEFINSNLKSIDNAPAQKQAILKMAGVNN